MDDLMSQLLQAILAASEERKKAALKVLRGEVSQPAERPVTGPLLFGMSAGAIFMGVSRATFWRLRKSGQLPMIEIMPGSFRVRRVDVEALADHGCRGTR